MRVQRCDPSLCAEPQHQETQVDDNIARACYDRWYGPTFGREQSLARIGERGGFSWSELVLGMPQSVNPHMPTERAIVAELARTKGQR